MIIRRNRPTTPIVAAVGALTFLVSCGDSAPTAPPPVSVAPSPSPSAEPPPSVGPGASSCSLGAGDPFAPCGKESSELRDYVENGIDRLIQEQPELFNLDDEAGEHTRQYRVVDKEGYLEGVVSTLNDMGLCAGRAFYDSEIVQVKIDNEMSEDYDIITADSFIRRGPATYRQSCSPAAFPIPRPDNAPPVGSGCGWPFPPPVSRFNVKVHLQGSDFDTLDSTPLVGHDALYCAAIGFEGRSLCPVRPEGHPEREACEAWIVGRASDTGRVGPTWTNPAGEYCTGPESGCANADNQYSLWVYAPGRYTACAENKACGSVEVEP